jgi:hypothetical protein
VHIFIFLKFFGLHELGSCFHVSELSCKVHMRASSSSYTIEEHKVVDVENTASETQDVHEADAKNNIMNHTGFDTLQRQSNYIWKLSSKVVSKQASLLAFFSHTSLLHSVQILIPRGKKTHW